MKLSLETLRETGSWAKINVRVPKINLREVRSNTKQEPKWVHFGSGNIFRGFIAGLQQNLIEKGLSNTGIIAAELFDYEIIDKIYKPYDNLALAVTLHANGTIDIELITNIAEALKADPDTKDWERLTEIFRSPSLQIVSFTITEKGYAIEDSKGEFLTSVVEDINSGPRFPKSSMGKVLSLLYERFRHGFPLTLMSLDNLSQNGQRLFFALIKIAEQWVERGHVSKDFIEYLSEKVSFPWTMIDKIVPAPSTQIRERLEKLGIEQMDIVITSKKTHIAPFVNMEEAQYLVIEDNFTGPRPLFEKTCKNIFVSDRQTVEKAERMKVTACLNPLHTAVSIFGRLLGYETIYECMRDSSIEKLARGVGEEGLLVTPDPGIISPREFLKEVLNVRLPNPYIPDTPQRILMDTSQKIPVRFGETMRSYYERGVLSSKTLKYIPLVIAGWLRYLMGVDDNGKSIELSPDPMLEELKRFLLKIEFLRVETVKDRLRPILENENLFRVNLYSTDLGEKIEGLFKKMISQVGAVRKTLAEVVEG
ncbi:MAG: mannitol dehydrogenase family protein [Pseudothermotoga sp.]